VVERVGLWALLHCSDLLQVHVEGGGGGCGVRPSHLHGPPLQHQKLSQKHSVAHANMRGIRSMQT